VDMGSAVTGIQLVQLKAKMNTGPEIAGLMIHLLGKFVADPTSFEEHLLLSESFALLWNIEEEGLLYPETRAIILVAAYLLDLIALKKIRIENVKKKHKVVVNDPIPVGNHLDRLFIKIVRYKKSRNLKKWLMLEQINLVNPSSDSARYGDDVLEGLVKKDLMTRRDLKKMVLFNHHLFHLKNTQPRDSLGWKIRSVLLENRPGTGHTMMLLGLLFATDQYSNHSLMPHIFSIGEVHLAKSQLNSIIGYTVESTMSPRSGSNSPSVIRVERR